jgi:NAD-dependent dihydropyrimidine dehydrogenase PreA subunit/flavodoxin
LTSKPSTTKEAKPMKVCLYYFSGTLNTERVAKTLQKEWGENCVLFRIQWPFAEIPNPNDFDLIGIGYPIHAFNTPKVVLDFFQQFPKAKTPKNYFIFKTSGEPLHYNDSSSRKLIHCLKKKGYACVQEFHYIMPYNIVFRHSDGMAKKMWVYAQKMAHYNTEKIKNGVVETPHFRPLQGWYIVPFRIEWPFAKTNGRFFKVDLTKCILCGVCVKVCPMANIVLEKSKIHFSSHCSLCMACSFSCPKKAIKPGMFHGEWIVNGSYHVEQLAADSAIVLPLKSREKHFNKAYDLYFHTCDNLLTKNDKKSQ